jgi:hypothetical protein
VDHIRVLIDRRWLSGLLDVQFFRVAVCHTDHCLVVVNVREKFGSE